MAANARSIDAAAIFRVFTACHNDPTTLLLDVRGNKDFKKRHINQAFNVRLSSNGQVLADYSQSSYSVVWSQAIWWGKPVIVYGPPGLSKSHPVINFLVQEGRCTAVLYLKDGYETFEKLYPFLCTPSVKANSIKKYASQVLDLLYLGDWGHAQDQERLDEIKVRRIITIHNNPDSLKPPPHVQHLRCTLADVDTEDISQFFNATFEFIEEGVRKGQAVLVHCGAGVSRSACLVIMYLMRSKHWSAKRARDYVVERRSLVCPNDGFWRTLCSLEGGLGIADRSDPTATSGFAGVDAPSAQLSADAVGARVAVNFEPVGPKSKQQAGSAATVAHDSSRDRSNGRRRAGEEGGSGRDEVREGREHGGSDRGRERGGGGRDGAEGRRRSADGRGARRSKSRERSRSPGRRRDSSRDRRDHSRERGREHGRRHSRERSRDRQRRGEDSMHKDDHSPAAPEAAAAAARNGSEAAAAAAAVAAAPPTHAPNGAVGWELTFEVSKPEATLGKLVLGPMRLHQRIVFGRDPGCEVVLEHLSVSRRHAQLGVDVNGRVTVTDLESAHGTKVGEVWVKAKAPRALEAGGVLRFGASTRAYKLLGVRLVEGGG